MSGSIFDTHAHVKRLMEAGFTAEQAEAQVMTLRELVESQLATKRDLKELELNMSVEMARSKSEILKWLVGLLVAQTAVVAALVKL